MPFLTTPLHEAEDYALSTGYAGEEDTTHAQGEEDPTTTAPVGEEDETSGGGTLDPFGAY